MGFLLECNINLKRRGWDSLYSWLWRDIHNRRWWAVCMCDFTDLRERTFSLLRWRHMNKRMLKEQLWFHIHLLPSLPGGYEWNSYHLSFIKKNTNSSRYALWPCHRAGCFIGDKSLPCVHIEAVYFLPIVSRFVAKIWLCFSLIQRSVMLIAHLRREGQLLYRAPPPLQKKNWKG